MAFFELLFWLLVGHALADYGLQTRYIAEFKSPKVNPKAWPWVLGAHSLIHGGAVTFVTGYIWLGVLEVIAHFAIDYAKSTGRFGEGARAYHIDQSLHVACKVVWALAALIMAAMSAVQ